MADNTRTTTIAGLALQVSDPYSEGHKINAAEAAVLNQTRAENLGNNLRKSIQELRNEDGTYSEAAAKQAQEMLDKTAADYEFSLTPRRGGAAGLSAEDREIKSVATSFLVGKIKEKGLTKKAYIEANGQDKFDELVAQIMQDEQVIAAGKEQYKAKQAAAKKQSKLLEGVEI